MSYVPITPAGSVMMDLERNTEEAAWRALEQAAAHMPYKDRAALVKRGYTIGEVGKPIRQQVRREQQS